MVNYIRKLYTMIRCSICGRSYDGKEYWKCPYGCDDGWDDRGP